MFRGFTKQYPPKIFCIISKATQNHILNQRTFNLFTFYNEENSKIILTQATKILYLQNNCRLLRLLIDISASKCQAHKSKK